MQQGKHRKTQREERRRRFHTQAQQPPVGGQQPPSAPAGAPQPAPIMETRPGHVAAIPPAQIQPHQVPRRSGLPGSQPDIEQPAYAPVAGQSVAMTGQGEPHQERIIRPRETVTPTPQADVTVILYSSGDAPVLLGAQLQALRRQTIQPQALWVHVDGPTGHDERTLAKLLACRTPMSFGRHHRLSIAREVETRYVVILEEDAHPGARWLERALEAIGDADNPALPYGPAVIACAGVLQGSEDPANAHVVGAELPRGDQSLEVDFGRQGWLFATDFARLVEGLPRVGVSSDSLGILIAAAAQHAGVPTVVLDYGTDKANWGSVAPHQHGLDPEDTSDAFEAYLEMGWEPPYTGSELAPVQPAPQPQGTPSLPVTAQPGQVTERIIGGIVTREFVLPPEQQTPDPSASRERVLQPHEATSPPESARTERLVEPAPPPESASSESIPTPSPPPESETGR